MMLAENKLPLFERPAAATGKNVWYSRKYLALHDCTLPEIHQ